MRFPNLSLRTCQLSRNSGRFSFLLNEIPMTNAPPESPDNRSPLFDNNPKSDNKSAHPFRRLVIFQLKLAVDALRDIILSPVSIVCSLIDMAEKRKGKDSYFEKLMLFGRNTEKKINLFEQHEIEESTIDSILNQVEGVVTKEYKDKSLSKKTVSAIEKILKTESKKMKDKS